ncbi:MAG: ferredoxin--NADP reductase [Gemmataceae bacterium]|nr:ferredoxin--NADP reductase [Gemmataceae bacterium]MCS7272413.1 ferredoxin--NADP reductase [Gemmataceae bacterium]MDW8241858.1 ferredoxin--NADP reductase [Thermogemmata sp.]
MTPEQIEQARAQRYNATIVYLKKVHSDLMILRVRPDFPRPSFQAGQYCTLGLGYWEPRVEGCQEEHLEPGAEARVVRRSYSISCPILDDENPEQLYDLDRSDWLEFYIVLVRSNPDGRVPAFTPRLFTRQVGDRIQMGEKIAGHYTLDPVRPGDTVVFLATGTGEAPHNTMIWELLRRGHTGRIVSVCCVRYKQDLGYLQTHQKLMERYPHYLYLPLTTREPGQTRKVYIQDLISSGELEERMGQPLDPARTHVYLCGNPRMIGVPQRDKTTGAVTYPQPAGAIEILEKRGFQADIPSLKYKGNIHFEEYW